MHKCIMVKLHVGGNEKHVKYVKTRTFYEISDEISKSMGEINNFPETGGNVRFCENRGKFKIFSQ